MAASDHESDDGDSGVNVGSFGVRDMSGIDRLYDHERKSRLGNVQGLLAMSAAGAISSILVIVPDSKWSKWVPEFREEGDKYPFHEVYIHAKTFAYHTTKLSNKEDYQRLNVYQKSRITLTSYSLLAKEYEIVWNHKGNDNRKSDFFRKIWGLTVLQNRKQIPDSSDIAKAAAMIHPSRGGRRYVVWDDDHWDGKTKKIAKASESRGGTQQKRKRVTNIKDGIISKKKQKLNRQEAAGDDEANQEADSDEEDHYHNDDGEITSPKQELAGEIVESTEAAPKLRRRRYGKS